MPEIKPMLSHDRRENLPIYYDCNRWQALTVDQSHRFPQCYKLRSSIPFNSKMKLNYIDGLIDIYRFIFNRFYNVPIKHIKQLQHCHFEN